jgi:hypothetical protein
VLASFVRGASRAGRRPSLRAVTDRLPAREVALLLAAAPGGLASRSIDPPPSYSKALVLIVGFSLFAGAVGGYLIFHNVRRYPRSRDSPCPRTTTSRVP